MPSFRRKGTWPILAAVVATAVATPRLAPAERQHVYLWGFQKSCGNLPEADRYVEKQLHAQHSDVWLLHAQKGLPLPAVCSPASSVQCGQALKGICPQVQGQLLGGSIVRGKDVLKFRLWLYDLQTGKVAYQDDYCQSCDLITALSAQAQRLLDQPQFGNDPGPSPQYCGQPTGPVSNPSVLSRGPIHLVVYGDGKHKGALLSALRAQLALRGRPVLPVTIESKSYTIDVLQKIVASNKDAQVVGVEIQREGKIGVFVFDGKTEQTADKVLECPDCAQNKDLLVARVQSEITMLLERCYGQECGGSAHIGAPPPEACEPFPEQACVGLEALMSQIPKLPEPASGVQASRLSPKTSRALTGLAWGGVALSAATSLGLFIANGTSAGEHLDNQGIPISGTLGYAAWATAGLTVGLIGLAIPTTIIVNKETLSQTTQPLHPDNLTTSPSPIRCPE